MKNYAEELAYWYFRFNGFFPLNNYVTHPEERINGEGYSDTDIIAIKPNGVRELVGLRTPIDYCNFLREAVINPNIGKNIGIICEVKAGIPPMDAVDNENIYAQVDRLGIPYNHPVGQAEGIPLPLNLNPNRDINDPRGLIYFDANIAVYRFICKRNDNHYMEYDGSWGILNINRIITFMTNQRFAQQIAKAHGWHQYDSSLIQFLLRHRELIAVPHV